MEILYSCPARTSYLSVQSNAKCVSNSGPIVAAGNSLKLMTPLVCCKIPLTPNRSEVSHFSLHQILSLCYCKAMITFISYPKNLGNLRHAQSKQVGPTQDAMDVDDFQDSDFGVGSNMLTCPGESLTSSQTYMRWAFKSRFRGIPNTFVYDAAGMEPTLITKKLLLQWQEPLNVLTSWYLFEQFAVGR